MNPTPRFSGNGSRTGRIGIVDGQAACRMGLTMQLHKKERFTVAWTSETAEEAFEKLAADQPDLLIVEIQLSGQDGLEFIKNIRPLYPDLPILVHSSQNEDFYATRCLQAGARGFLHKGDPMRFLLPALEKILGGEVFLSPRAASKAIRSLSSQPCGTTENGTGKELTDRELEVIILMAKGDSCQDTANKLHISPRTVQVHRTNIRNKLGLDSALRLHAYAVRFYGEETELGSPGLSPTDASSAVLSRSQTTSRRTYSTGKREKPRHPIHAGSTA